MKKLSVALRVSMLFLACSAVASESPTSEIRESTDPTKATEVEQHAADIQSRQQASGAQSSGESGTASKTPGKHGHTKKHAHKASKEKSAESTSGASEGAGAGAGSSGDQSPGSESIWRSQ